MRQTALRVFWWSMCAFTPPLLGAPARAAEVLAALPTAPP